MVKIVYIKNKRANHTLWLRGKPIKFADGKAEVSEVDAAMIKGLSTEKYTFKDPTTAKRQDTKAEAEAEAEPKTEPRKTKRKSKPKAESEPKAEPKAEHKAEPKAKTK